MTYRVGGQQFVSMTVVNMLDTFGLDGERYIMETTPLEPQLAAIREGAKTRIPADRSDVHAGYTRRPEPIEAVEAVRRLL